MITLASLQSLVENASEADVKAAVADYSQRNPIYAYSTLERSPDDSFIYPLPANFLYTVKLESLGLPKFYILDNTLNFTQEPTPNEIGLWYAGGHILNENQEYPNLRENEAYIIKLKLQAIVTRNGGESNEGLRYKDGDVEVDTKGVADSRNKSVAALENTYLEAIKQLIGTVGIRSDLPHYSS